MLNILKGVQIMSKQKLVVSKITVKCKKCKKEVEIDIDELMDYHHCEDSAFILTFS